jgi:hypothetical protein
MLVRATIFKRRLTVEKPLPQLQKVQLGELVATAEVCPQIFEGFIPGWPVYRASAMKSEAGEVRGR